MAKAVIINGSNKKTSRLSGIHQFIESYLKEADVSTHSIYVHDLPATDLITANYASKEINQANELVARANIVFVLTPIFKASYTGILKTYLDLIPQKGLEHKVVVPIALGGSIGHLLAVEYALKPVLSVLGANEILNTVYLLDHQIKLLDNGQFEIAEEAINRLHHGLSKLQVQTLEKL